MQPLTQVFAGIFGLIGGCCSAVLPFTSSSSLTSNSQVAGGGDVKNVALVSSGGSSSASYQGINSYDLSQGKSFDEIWKEVNEAWRSKQSSGLQRAEELPGKSQLSTILLKEDRDGNNKTGKVLESDWKNCQTTSKGLVSHCGYLHLHLEGLNKKYKLRVSYEREIDKSLASGRVWIVKNGNGKTSYGDNIKNTTENGLEVNSMNFGNLKISTTDEGSEWTKVESPAFKTEVEDKVLGSS